MMMTWLMRPYHFLLSLLGRKPPALNACFFLRAIYKEKYLPLLTCWGRSILATNAPLWSSDLVKCMLLVSLKPASLVSQDQTTAPVDGSADYFDCKISKCFLHPLAFNSCSAGIAPLHVLKKYKWKHALMLNSRKYKKITNECSSAFSNILKMFFSYLIQAV